MNFEIKTEQRIVNLMVDEGGESELATVVVIDREETIAGTLENGAAKIGDNWYQVVSVGGVWQAAWSNRQQRFVTITEEVFVGRLEKMLARCANVQVTA